MDFKINSSVGNTSTQFTQSLDNSSQGPVSMFLAQATPTAPINLTPVDTDLFTTYTSTFLKNATTSPVIDLTYDPLTGVYQYSDCPVPTFFVIYIQLSFNITSALGQREFNFRLKRADGTVLRTATVIKQAGVTTLDGNVVLMTYVNGPLDSFVVQGFKLSTFTDNGTGTITNSKLFIDTKVISP
jgi:hypothetical protein